MSRICSICGKSPVIGGKRKLLIGHYNPVGKRWVYPNLQWMTTASGKRVKACAKCIRNASKKPSAPKSLKVKTTKTK